MNNKNKASGIGGWLLIFILYLIYILFSLIWILTKLGYISIGLPIIIILDLYFIFKKSKKAIKFNKIIWKVSCIATLIILLIDIFTKNYSSLPYFLASIIISIIWFNYWKRSVRVKNTFVN